MTFYSKKCKHIANTRLLTGFTLIEVITAVFILTVGILAVSQMFPLGVKVQKSAQMNSVAVQLGQAEMEEIISKWYDDISNNSKQEFDPPFSAYSKETEVTYFDPDNPQIIPDEDKGIKKIKVIISWKSSLGLSEKSINITTLITEK